VASSKKRIKGRFVGIPYHVANSPEFAELNGNETRLLVHLLLQYNGQNNGKLSTTLSLLRERGWSSSNLYRAHKGLLEKGFLVVTLQGWKQRGHPTLVAITWNGIDECGIEYDDGIVISTVPLGLWKKQTSISKS